MICLRAHLRGAQSPATEYTMDSLSSERTSSLAQSTRQSGKLGPSSTKLSKVAKNQSSKRKRWTDQSDEENNANAHPLKKPRSSTKPKRAHRRNIPALLSTFTIFSELPIEIRWKIWGIAADADTAVIAQVKPTVALNYKIRFSLLRARFQVPPLLHACWEARTECIINDPIKRLKAEASVASPSRELIADAAARGAKTYREALAMIRADRAGDPVPAIRKTVHARWSLYTFRNYRMTYTAYPARNMYVSTNDVFWGFEPNLLMTFWETSTNEKLSKKVQHLVGTSSELVKYLEDVFILKSDFPALQTITHLLDDFTGQQKLKQYYTLGAEINGELTTGTLKDGEKLEVDRFVSVVKKPKRIPMSHLADLAAKLFEQLQLKFRFEVQFVKKEIPELGKKPKYRRPVLP